MGLKLLTAFSIALGYCTLGLPPALALLLVAPEAITVEAVRGESIVRRVTLEADRPIQELTIQPREVVTAEETEVIPATAITIQPLEPQVAPDLQQIDITIDTAELGNAGQFSGTLLVRTEQGQQPISIRVVVKDPVGWPLLSLGLGVILGVGLSVYRSEGQEHDRILVQVGRLRSRMKVESYFPRPFRTHLEQQLAVVEMNLEDGKWEQARQTILAGQALWERWLAYRQDWLTQINYLDSLKGEIRAHIPENSAYAQFCLQKLEQIQSAAIELPTPYPLQTQLQEINQYLVQYQRGWAEIQVLSQRCQDLPESSRLAWTQLLQSLEPSLNAKTPEQYADWQAQMESLRGELDNAVSAHQSQGNLVPHEGDSATRSRGLMLQVPRVQISLVPPIALQRTPEGRVARAQGRIIAVNWLSRSLAVVLLSWTGLNQIYGSNPSFGADPFADYFALLAWGLGAETTRSSMLKVIQDLGIQLPEAQEPE